MGGPPPVAAAVQFMSIKPRASAPDLTAMTMMHHGVITETLRVRRGERELVLKRLATHALSSNEARLDLAREGRIVAELDGRGTPRFVAMEGSPHDPYILSEMWPGESLLGVNPSVVRSHFSELVKAAFRALAEVHEANDVEGPLAVVHGDISPANVMADSLMKDCVLVDFQLASDRYGGPRRDGAFRGTLSTVAPEVARGEAPRQGSDVFSLAATLIEAGHGAPIRAGVAPAARLVRAADEPIDHAAQLLRGVAPQRMLDVLRAALAHDPIGRIQTARAVLDALD